MKADLVKALGAPAAAASEAVFILNGAAESGVCHRPRCCRYALCGWEHGASDKATFLVDAGGHKVCRRCDKICL